MAKLNRQTTEYSVIYPQFAIAASWGYEMEGNRPGMGVNLNLSAAPLIGISIKWDLLELLCRRHPIAYAILKAVDGLLYILADDESAVRCDFIVKGEISTNIDWDYNKATGFKELNAKGKSAIQAKLELELRLVNSVEYFGYEAYIKRGVLAGAGIGLGIQDYYGIDNKGMYIKKEIIFEGIKLYFSAEANAGLTRKGGKKKKEIFDLGGKIEGEITMLAHTFSTDKLYLTQ